MGEIRQESRPQEIAVDVPDQLAEGGPLFHHDGLVPVLEEGADPVMPAVVGEGISGEAPPHEPGQALGAAPEQQVGMVGQQGPGVEGRPGGRGHRAQARHKGLAVLLIGHDPPPLHPAEDDVVQGPRNVESRLPGHRRLRPPVWTA
jgi:hypothetical protein